MSTQKAVLIGITGQIGAGKSTVAKILKSLGCLVISGDELGRYVVDSSATLRKKLARAFGDDVIISTGAVNRAALARKAFATDSTHRTLNVIVHPPLLRELDSRIRRNRYRAPIIVIDASLLIEWGYHKKMDEVVVVTAPKALRYRWLKSRGMLPKDIAARERLQMTQKEFSSYATKVCRNSGSVRLLRSSVAAWLKSIVKDRH